MEILIGNKTPQIEQPGVCPVRSQKQIRGTRAGLQTSRQQTSPYVGQICAPCWNLGAERNGCLCRPALRISTVETVLYEHHGIAKPRSASGRCARHVKTIRDDWNENRQIKIAVKSPREVEVSLVRKSRPGRCRNTLRRSRHQSTCGKNGVVRDKPTARKQRRGRFRSGALPSDCWSTNRHDKRQRHQHSTAKTFRLSQFHGFPSSKNTHSQAQRSVRMRNNRRSV